MTEFADYIETTYGFNLSIPDQQILHEVSSEEADSLKKRVERKYQISKEVLGQYASPIVQKTIKQLLKESPQFGVKALNRMKDLLKMKASGYLDDALFDKYHRRSISKLRIHNKLMEMVNEAKDQQLEPEEFRKYLNSGLFDQGIYTLKRGPSEEELQKTLDEMRLEIYTRYQFSICDKDVNFILNNRVQNHHIITQIVFPKYRIGHNIIQLLGGHFMDPVIQKEIEYGMNEGVPILNRIKSLAEWFSEGYLSKILVRKFHHTLVYDLDELEEFTLFMELISEYISKDRAIHYMELGLYEIFDEKKFQKLLKIEQSLYDISDDLAESVSEYIRIMKTPAASKSLITNRRLAQCFVKFVHAADSLFEHSDILEISRYEDRLQQYLNGFTRLYRDYYGKNPSLPSQKPYKAIEFIKPFARMFFNIESENLLRQSLQVYNKSQEIFKSEKDAEVPVIAESIKQYHYRFKTVHDALKNPKEFPKMIGKLIPLKTHPMNEIDAYLNKKA